MACLLTVHYVCVVGRLSASQWDQLEEQLDALWEEAEEERRSP
jgi:hypothetical protein